MTNILISLLGPQKFHLRKAGIVSSRVHQRQQTFPTSYAEREIIAAHSDIWTQTISHVRALLPIVLLFKVLVDI